MSLTTADSQPTSEDLDDRIGVIESWLDRAAESLLTFEIGDSPSGGFRRNTLPVSAERPGCTSTSRSYLALFEYRRYLAEEERKPAEELDRALSKTFKSWIMPLGSASRLTDRLSESENGENLFTKAHLLMALVASPGVASDLGIKDPEQVSARLNRSCSRLASDLREGFDDSNDPGALGLHKDDPATHNFLALHGLRALDFGAFEFGVDGLRSQVLRTVLDHLAYSSAGVLSRFDPGQLASSATLLARLKAPDRERLIQHSAQVVGEVQTDDGAWLSEQIVGASGLGRIFVSSYEVALCFTFLASHEIAHGNVTFATSCLATFEKVFDLILATYVSADERDDPFRGWANDRSRWPGLVESWATASVLSFLLRYRDILLSVRQSIVLERYRADRFDLGDEPDPWPDLDRARAGTPHLNEEALSGYSDPTDDLELVGALTSNLLEPTLRQPGLRPERASAILYGAPGTRKTSLVKASAKALGWPLVTLSPPDFLGDGGLEGFELAAARIFEDLLRLRRAVVLFDECEDFFKPRRSHRSSRGAIDLGLRGQESLGRPESRTIGAFVTAGMLPRLQKLRDERWVIFFLATNSSLDDLDDAIRRPGRFDYARRIDDPTLRAQQRYVDNHRRQISRKQRVAVRAVLRKWAESNDPAQWFGDVARRSEDDPQPGAPVPFAVIDYIINTVRDFAMEGSREEVERLLSSRMQRVADPPDFSRDQAQ